MTRSRILLAALAVTGCSYFQGSAAEPSVSPAPAKPAPKMVPVAIKVASANALVKAMHDLYSGKFLKTMSFLQNNTAYAITGQEQKSQWYEHIEVPGKLRIAFLPASQRSGLVQIDDRVASFDNGIRVDFRPSVNPVLLLTADVYAAPLATITRGLDSLHVDQEIIRSEEWEGQPVYVVGAKAGDTTSNQMWVDRDHLRLVRFIQAQKAGKVINVSDIRVLNY